MNEIQISKVLKKETSKILKTLADNNILVVEVEGKLLPCRVEMYSKGKKVLYVVCPIY